MSGIRGLTLKQPWTFAVAHAGKRVENRGWVTGYTGLIAVHAAARTAPLWQVEESIARIVNLSGLPEARVWQGAQVRGAIVAVARLTGVCSKSFYMAFNAAPGCECGPWAVNGQRHFLLADVRVLPEPVPCKGALGLWRLPEDVYAAVHAALGMEATAS